jgi:hypothetical protein
VKETLQFSDDLLQGFELGLLASRSECFPIRLRACVLNEPLAKRDDLTVGKGRAAAPECGPEGDNERLAVERHAPGPATPYREGVSGTPDSAGPV